MSPNVKWPCGNSLWPGASSSLLTSSPGNNTQNKFNDVYMFLISDVRQDTVAILTVQGITVNQGAAPLKQVIYTELLTLQHTLPDWPSQCWWWLIWPKQNDAKNQKKEWLKPWHLGTHLRVLNEGYPMSTNMTGFKNCCILVLWMKVTSALEGLSYPWFSSSTSYKVASQEYFGNIKKCYAHFRSVRLYKYTMRSTGFGHYYGCPIFI